VIVRISTENQYELPDEVAERLNDLDNLAVEAVEAGSEERFREVFEQMLGLVRSEGHLLDEDILHGSDVILPPPDITFEEAQDGFSGEGLIPD
jgi:PspAA-like protein